MNNFDNHFEINIFVDINSFIKNLINMKFYMNKMIESSLNTKYIKIY